MRNFFWGIFVFLFLLGALAAGGWAVYKKQEADETVWYLIIDTENNEYTKTKQYPECFSAQNAAHLLCIDLSKLD